MKTKRLFKILTLTLTLICISAGLTAQTKSKTKSGNESDSLKVMVKVAQLKSKTEKIAAIPDEKKKEYEELLYESEQLKEEMKGLAPDNARYKEIMRERKTMRSQLDAITGEDKKSAKNPPTRKKNKHSSID